MEKIQRYVKPVLLVVLLVVVCGIWYAVFYFEFHQELRITFFDVGQGDAIFIEDASGNQVLIDGGPGDKVLASLGERMPFWDRKIELLILTHPHADHLDGLFETLHRYEVGQVIESGVNHTIPEYKEWRELLKEKGVTVVTAERGQRIGLSRGAYIDILSPFENYENHSLKDMHDAMVVLRLVYGSTTALFMGDAEQPLEYKILYSGSEIDSDILKVGHHGSKTSSGEAFLRAVSPDISVISLGRKNRYGHPHQRVVDRLASLGGALFRTDEVGDITIISSGGEPALVK